jgi:hypothetical protein
MKKNKSNIHALESYSGRRCIRNSANEIRKKGESNSLSSDRGRKDLRGPDKRRGVYALVCDNIQKDEDKAGGVAGFVCGADIFPLEEGFSDKDGCYEWVTDNCEQICQKYC